MNARAATWHVAQDCLPDTDKLLSLNRASPAVAANESALSPDVPEAPPVLPVLPELPVLPMLPDVLPDVVPTRPR